MRTALLALGLASTVLFAPLAPARAQDAEPPVFRLLLKGRKFEPARLSVPANTRFVLMVRNGEDSPVEFESGPLGVEKIISAGREATVRLGPLKPGEYAFIDDFHQTAKGVLVASEK